MAEKQVSENLVKTWIKKRLESWGAWSVPIPSNGMGVSGVPDRLCLIPRKDYPVFVGIEAKRPGRRGEKNRGCSELQVKQLLAIAATGGIGWVVDSHEDLDMLQRVIEAYNGIGVCNLDFDYWVKK